MKITGMMEDEGIKAAQKELKLGHARVPPPPPVTLAHSLRPQRNSRFSSSLACLPAAFLQAADWQ